MGLLAWALIRSDWCLYKKRRLGHRDTRDTCAQRKDLVKTQREGGCLQAKGKDPADTLISDLQPLEP